jgi:hypothetical protein
MDDDSPACQWMRRNPSENDIWLGKAPDVQGIDLAEKYVPKDVNLIRDGQYNTPVPSIFVAAGIAIQSQYYNKFKDGRLFTWFSGGGMGYAQVSRDQLKAYGLAGQNPQDPDVAVLAMMTRIGLALDACGDRCTDEDKLYIAAMAQNGSGFKPEWLEKEAMFNKNGVGINWNNFFKHHFGRTEPRGGLVGYREAQTGYHYDSAFMLLLFLNDLRELHRRGWELPWDLTVEKLDEIESQHVVKRYD